MIRLAEWIPLTASLKADLVGERRRRPRACIRWLLCFPREGLDPLQSTTENISSDGLYCILNERVQPGDHLNGALCIPCAASDRQTDILLHCTLEVIHVSSLGQGFGVGCRLEQYTIVRDSVPRTPLARPGDAVEF